MTTSIGAGIGGFAAIAKHGSTYGDPYVTPTRTLNIKSFKATYEQHPVQGGPYLRNGQIFDQGSARVLTWLDAKGVLTGDVLNTGAALLLAAALGSSATLTAIGTTAAFGLGGAAGTSASAADLNNIFVDLQAGVPDAGGTLHPENYHSGYVTKAVWVFERDKLVTYSYDVDFQYLEKSTSLIVPSFAAAPVPFTMVTTAATPTSAFKMGAFGSEAAVDGVRKATVTLERKVSDARIYLGNQYKDVPVTNNVASLKVALEFDYTAAAKTAIADLQLSGAATSIVIAAVGNQIGTSGQYDTFQLNPTNCFLDTGGESSLDGPDIVKNTANFSATIDNSGDAALKALLLTADTTF